MAKPSPQPNRSDLLPLLERYSLAIALLLIAIATARIVSTYHVFADVGDEPAHLACGMQYVSQHIYRYEPEHPPLVRALIAIGPYLAGIPPLGNEKFGIEGVTLLIRSGRPDHFLMLARLGVLPFFWLACTVVYLWTRRSFGGAAAVIATAIFTLIPAVLAHAGLANIDMGLAGTLAAAFYTFLLWSESPTPGRSVLWGAATGAAVLSKFTAMVFFPVIVLLAIIAIWLTRRPKLKPYLAPAAMAIASGAVVIWAAYFFSVGVPAGWKHAVPAPALFEGIQAVLRLNAYGHPSYLLGEPGWKGWWYYFPVALGVKTPLAVLLLVLGGFWLAWTQRQDARYLLPAAYCLGILLPAMTGNVNVGVRYILPIFVGFAVLAAPALLALYRRSWIAAGALLFWLAVSSGLAHPNYIPYFNELARGEPVLLDSDYDWGQDTKRLAARLHELGATQVNFNALDRDWRNPLLEVWPGLPRIKTIHPTNPAEGWTAVNPTIDKTLQYGLEYRYPNLKPWYNYLQPVERVGTLELYYVPPGSLKR